MHFPLPVVSSIIMFIILSVMLWRAYRKKFSSLSSWFLFFTGSALVFTFIFCCGTWAFTSLYARWFFLLIYITGIIYSFNKHLKMPWRSDKIKSVWFAVSRVFVILIGGFLVYMYIDSGTYHSKPVELEFPYKNGTFYIMQGGSNRLSNFFHSGFSKSHYGYAMDLAELNEFGNRAKSIYSSNLNDYEIFKDTIYSPCSGKIIRLVDGIKDNPPGELNTKQVHGNHMVIESNGYWVFMAHLEAGKIFVKQGEMIRAGQPIALQGNAGFTVEPHLHLNVLRDYDSVSNSGISTPATFKGKFYTLNGIIKN
ncbi:MAG: M23 family metallopeptidase [Sphingobacteriales bacterium]|nr:MAG: M23 family metallopeptidase [Sphingobacteriales bacterium]